MSNNNPTGINGHPDCPSKDDEVTNTLICNYHRAGVTNRNTVSELLHTEHNISMAPATISQRFKFLGLKCAGATTKELESEVIRQHVLDEMAGDPMRRKGPTSVKEAIALKTGVHITRAKVRDEMRAVDPDGFTMREPDAQKVHRGVLVSLGPHHEWSCDGHDKLSKIGFPIWGVRDKWSGKWLGLWVVPNNRFMAVIAYLYLSLIVLLGGMPIQSTTDCGSETTLMYGLATALRATFSPAFDIMGPAHSFLKSIYNITIERGWSCLRISWGDNVKVFWEAGIGIYDPTIPKQYELVQWLWPKLIQQELDFFVECTNNHKVRNNNTKMNPSGVSPNICYALPQKYGGENCLQNVNIQMIQGLMEDIGGEELIQFVPPEYAVCAQEVYDHLNIEKLSFDNVWFVFSAMLPNM